MDELFVDKKVSKEKDRFVIRCRKTNEALTGLFWSKKKITEYVSYEFC